MTLKHKITSHGRTDVGQKRQTNQDSILLDASNELYAVADGMGGHKGGEVASAMTLDILKSMIASISTRRNVFRPSAYLKEVVALASLKIKEKAMGDDSLTGMGTTLVAVYFFEGVSYIVQVGDSRVYLYRDSSLWQITEDHSLINEQLRQGVITEGQAQSSDYKNVITRSVGFEDTANADVYMRDVQAGDVFLLCSDGLSSMISDETIRQNINSADLKGSVDKLIELANKSGGNDNVSVILVRVG